MDKQPRHLFALLSLILAAPTLNVVPAKADDEFTPKRLARPFPAIINPKNISADQAKNEIRAKELVIGVTVNGESRAYPINMMSRPTREIVTDKLGGKRIAVTWCHLCHNSLVFAAEQDGNPITLVVSGMLWKSNLVMQDLETKSLWSHMLGECMQGEMKGTTLGYIPCEITTWEDWLARNPKTTSLFLKRTMKRYERDFYSDMRGFVLIHSDFKNARAWRLSDLAKQPLLNDSFGKEPLLMVFDNNSTSARIYSRSLSDSTLTFEAGDDGQMKDRETGSLWSLDTATAISGPLKGKSLSPLVGTLAKRKSWTAFYPKGTLWSGPETTKTKQ